MRQGACFLSNRTPPSLESPNAADIYVTNILRLGVTNLKESALFS